MPTANAIASRLREIADMLDKTPNAELTDARLNFYHHGAVAKDQFINLTKVFPRPFEKGDGYHHDQLTIEHHCDELSVYASIDRSAVCVLREPAKPAVYDCVPLLSLEEEAALGPF